MLDVFLIVTTFPSEFGVVKVVTVVFVEFVKFTCREPSNLKSLKVFDPATIKLYAFVVLFQKLLYVLPPPVNVTSAVRVPVYLIVPVLAETVPPVQFQRFPVVPVIRWVAEPSVNVPPLCTNKPVDKT